MSDNSPRILLGHTYLGRGGAEVAAMWYLQALSEDYPVDLVTPGGIWPNSTGFPALI
jgi:hypothetical protein